MIRNDKNKTKLLVGRQARIQEEQTAKMFNLKLRNYESFEKKSRTPKQYKYRE